MVVVAALFIQNGYSEEPVRPPGLPKLRCCDSPRSTEGDTKAEAAGVVSAKPPLNKGLKILILGDSMSLAGFGSRLDSRLRKLPEVASVNTYMACGANPLSWLKRKPYTNTRTRCGFWSIEARAGGKSPAVVKDTYGMRRGHKPSSHRVPKLEDLISRHRPDILIFQNGNNMFGCFKDKRTIKKKTHSNAIRWYVKPFIDEISSTGTSLKKFYFITPPEAGCVTKDIQKFLYEQLAEHSTPVANMIDSRQVTSYPYKMMGPDKEHFWGPEANNWADSVYDLITADFQSQSLKQLPTLDRKSKSRPEEKSQPKIEPIPEESGSLRVLARLSKPTAVPAPETFAPYQELLVGYRYEIEKVLGGKLEDQAVLVMHPAYIKLKPQDLSSYQIGKSYEFELKMMDDRSLWGGIRTRDDTDSFELMPYLLTKDENRHPDAKEDKPKREKATLPIADDTEKRPSEAADKMDMPTVPPEAPMEVPQKKELPVLDSNLKVLFLGESMSLMGFGARLDSHLRALPEISSVNTYMTCGTNPLSWMKKAPYTSAKTRCGFWSIESEADDTRPREFKDIQGMKDGYGPSAHAVPKLEDLMANQRPDILIYQGGNSLFRRFKDKRTITNDSHARAIRWHLDPLVGEASKPGTSLKKFYFITPPEAGSVPTEIQRFVFEQLDEGAGPAAKMIDSRKFTSYPYPQMGTDKDSFWGAETNEWADQVLEIIKADLRANSLEDLATLDMIKKSSHAE